MLLNANVAFLQVVVQNTDTSVSLCQIFSYLSIVTSMGTVLLGLLLVRQNRGKVHRETPTDVVRYHTDTLNIMSPHFFCWQAQYLTSIKSKRFGLEPLAVVYSLPYALLMWA